MMKKSELKKRLKSWLFQEQTASYWRSTVITVFIVIHFLNPSALPFLSVFTVGLTTDVQIDYEDIAQDITVPITEAVESMHQLGNNIRGNSPEAAVILRYLIPAAIWTIYIAYFYMIFRIFRSLIADIFRGRLK